MIRASLIQRDSDYKHGGSSMDMYSVQTVTPNGAGTTSGMQLNDPKKIRLDSCTRKIACSILRAIQPAQGIEHIERILELRGFGAGLQSFQFCHSTVNRSLPGFDP